MSFKLIIEPMIDGITCPFVQLCAYNLMIETNEKHLEDLQQQIARNVRLLSELERTTDSLIDNFKSIVDSFSEK